MLENKFVRFDESIHHPGDRCIGQSHKTGDLCPYIKVEGTDYCARHAANKQIIKTQKQELNNYRLGKYKQRVSELTYSSGIKGLREEIGILRMVLESILESCQNDTELLLYSNRIADLAMKIEKLVVSCDRLENRMGMLMDKNSVLVLAENIIEIISIHVTDESQLEDISQRIAEHVLA